MTDHVEPNEATAVTAASNSAAQISFDDEGDFGRATQGLVAQIEDGKVVVGDHLVFDVARHAFVNESETAPPSVHPGLWRQARLNVNHGLFEVADGVWQVRGYDIANITFMAGTDGWLIIDPLTNAPAAAAALRLANETLGARPVRSIIYTHSHVDHFGGVLGVTSHAEVDAGEVEIVAPEGFLREVVNEFVIAGPIMGRRASYQFGPFLPPGPLGHIDCGLGSAMGLAGSDLIAPTTEIKATGDEMDLSGIRAVFQMTPDAEAPAEMNFFFPDIGPTGGGSGGGSGKTGLLCMAENCTHTLHNLYPIRGAQIRDSLAWSKYIQEALQLWGDRTHTMFASHHWPRFGGDDVRGFLTLQRDVYRWMHDQTMRLANNGLVPTEIAAELELPAEFDQSHVRGYYGTVSHNVRSVYNRYLGWYDGNPANLNPLPPVDAGAKYVEFMGGAEAVLTKARQAYEAGDYRWVAQVVNHLVFAEPGNRAARLLQADALEQLGYQSESATWRNAYLMGAKELREGSPEWTRIPTRDMGAAMTGEQVFDIIGVRFNPDRFLATGSGRGLVGSAASALFINWHIADLDEDHAMGIGRSAIHHAPGGHTDAAGATMSLTRSQLVAVLGDESQLEAVDVTGDRSLVTDLFGSLEVFSPPALIEP